MPDDTTGKRTDLLVEEIKICGAFVWNIAIPSTFGFVLVVPLDLAAPVILLVDIVTFVIEGEIRLLRCLFAIYTLSADFSEVQQITYV
jgi:hypothetical protein